MSHLQANTKSVTDKGKVIPKCHTTTLHRDQVYKSSLNSISDCGCHLQHEHLHLLTKDCKMTCYPRMLNKCVHSVSYLDSDKNNNVKPKLCKGQWFTLAT